MTKKTSDRFFVVILHFGIVILFLSLELRLEVQARRSHYDITPWHGILRSILLSNPRNTRPGPTS